MASQLLSAPALTLAIVVLITVSACGDHGGAPARAAVGSWRPLSTGSPPDVAPDVAPPITGVWTGTHLLVWGRTAYCPEGTDSSALCANGASYDPRTDAWRPLSSLNAPQARDLHSGTWTGSEFFIWGGEGCGSLLGPCRDGGLYDPSTDQWRVVASADAVSPRGQHTAVWTGGEIMIFGGAVLPRVSGKIETLADGWSYDPMAWTWAAIPRSGAPSGRYWHTAVWTGSQMIVWGGTHDGTAPLGDGAAYDPVAKTWSALPMERAPHTRYAHSAVWTGKEMIVWGGLGCEQDEQGALPCNDGAAYDPRTCKWRPLVLSGAPAPSGGWGQAVWANDGMLIWGGVDSPGGEIYEPTSDRWTPMATTDQPSARSGQLSLWTGTELLVWGGLVGERTVSDGGRFSM